MTIADLRKYRGVPAKRGMRVILDGRPGVITGNMGDGLRIRFDGERRGRGKHHPWWEVAYLNPDGTVLKDYREASRPKEEP